VKIVEYIEGRYIVKNELIKEMMEVNIIKYCYYNIMINIK